MQELLQEMQNGALISFEIGALGALFEPSSSSETKLIASEQRLIRDLVLAVDKQLLAALSSPTLADFELVRDRTFPKYVRALRALSDTTRNLEGEEDIEFRAIEVSARIASDLEIQRGIRFTNELVDQALFTLWTAGKMRSLGRQIASYKGKYDKAADGKLIRNYHFFSLWAQFHMDSVVAAIKFDRFPAGELQRALVDGLRAMVNAYAIMKEGYSLRIPCGDAPPVSSLPWDEEDEALLASSMRDMNAISRDRDN